MLFCILLTVTGAMAAIAKRKAEEALSLETEFSEDAESIIEQELSEEAESIIEQELSTGKDTAKETKAGRERANAGFSAGIEEIWELPEEVKAAIESREIQIPIQTVGMEEQEVQEDEYSNLAIADVDHYVNVRSQPDTEGEIVGKMYDGSVAQVISTAQEKDGEWFQVISGDVEGYIKAEFFIYGDAAADVIEDYVTRYALVRADRLNVRKQPDIESSRIGYMAHGEKAQILEYDDEWTQIFYGDGKEGYVSSEYISVEEEFIYAKSIEEERAEAEAERQREARETQTEQEAPEDTTIVVEPPANYTTHAELRSAIVQYALQYVGMPYVHGGRSLATGTDCSGFTSYVYAEFGYGLSRTPQGQWSSNGRSISVEEIQPGDIVCYTSGGSKCTHVGIYIGNGQIVHAANPRKGTVVNDIYYGNQFIGVKNVID